MPGNHSRASRCSGGDEVTVGRHRLVFRATEPAGLTQTVGEAPPPELTRRERDVLRELCRPLFSGQMYAEAAALKDIAAALVVTEAAVQQHLLNLYGKFDIDGSGTRRAKLANAALRRGAISAAEFRRAES